MKKQPVILVTFAAMALFALVGWGIGILLGPADMTAKGAAEAAFELKMWGVVLGSVLGVVASAVYFWFRTRGRKETAYQAI